MDTRIRAARMESALRRIEATTGVLAERFGLTVPDVPSKRTPTPEWQVLFAEAVAGFLATLTDKTAPPEPAEPKRKGKG